MTFVVGFEKGAINVGPPLLEEVEN
jgi:hypothetical protein